MKIVDVDAHPPLEDMELDYLGVMSAEAFLKRLARAGVDAACGTPLLREGVPDGDPLRLMQINQRALELAKASEGRYRMAVWVHPACPDRCAEMIARFAGEGALMAGDIQPEWIEEDSPGLRVIMNAARDSALPVNARVRGAEQAEALARRYPDVRLLIGGGAAGVAPLDAAELLARHPNLYLHLSSPGMTTNYVLHSLLRRLPEKRLLFGTNYPFCNPAAKRAAVEWELRDAPPETRAAIMGGNALDMASGPARRGGDGA